jgi:hypothetical protein
MNPPAFEMQINYSYNSQPEGGHWSLAYLSCDLRWFCFCLFNSVLHSLSFLQSPWTSGVTGLIIKVFMVKDWKYLLATASLTGQITPQHTGTLGQWLTIMRPHPTAGVITSRGPDCSPQVMTKATAPERLAEPELRWPDQWPTKTICSVRYVYPAPSVSPFY